MHEVTYEESRNIISDGDFVFVCNGKTLWSRITQRATASDTHHCGIAFWIRDCRYKSRLMIVEAHPSGRRIVSLSSYQDKTFEVISSPVDWEMHCDPLLDNTGIIPYSFREYAWIGLTEVFNIQRKVDDPGEVCSKMVAEYCKSAGYDLGTTDISPGRLKKRLLELNAGFEHKCKVSQSI